jgi:citrate lyase beta subunit
VIFLDLEDAVAPELKDEARAAAVAAVAEPFGVPAAIRVNGAASEWFEAADCAAVRTAAPTWSSCRGSKARGRSGEVAERTGKPVAAMIETPLGVRRCWEIAEEAAALIAGTNDLAATLRLPAERGGRRCGPRCRRSCWRRGRRGCRASTACSTGWTMRTASRPRRRKGGAFGFDGKTLIHPDQIAPLQGGLRAGRRRSRGPAAGRGGEGGAQRFEGEMIERMHVEAAERLLAR